MWERASCKNLYSIVCDGLIQACVHADALSRQSKQAVWEEELGAGGRTPTDTALFYPLESVLETAATNITTWKRHELRGNKKKKIQSEVSVHGKFVTKLLHVCLQTGFERLVSDLKASLCLEVVHICCIACWDRLDMVTRTLATILKLMSWPSDAVCSPSSWQEKERRRKRESPLIS